MIVIKINITIRMIIIILMMRLITDILLPSATPKP